MAERSIAISIFLFALTFSLYINSALSSTLTTTTTTLDVTASIQRTLDVLSLNPQSLEQQQQTTTLSPSLSLPLYPRSALHKPHHKDYKSLTLSRLARDSARVDSITAKLDLEVMNGSSRSNLSDDSGEYFSKVGVGTPARQFYMALDTGSEVSWIQCKPCTQNLHNQSDQVFDPAGSSSYRPVQCFSKLCSDSICNGMNCRYKVQYTDKTHSEGDLVTETVSLGASGSFSNIAIGCGQDNKCMFARAAGLIGLGHGSLSLPSQIKATSFSYCLVGPDSRSSSTLEFNSAPPSDSVTVPMFYNMIKKNPYFYVNLTGISVGDKMLPLPPSSFQIDKNGDGGVIVDSGTTLTRLQTQAYESLRDSFVQMTQHLPLTKNGFDTYDTCYDLSSWIGKTVFVPVVSFHFAGYKTLSLKANNVLVPVDSAGNFCFAFAKAPKGQCSIIGNMQQKGTRVSYDLANMRIGFSVDKC